MRPLYSVMLLQGNGAGAYGPVLPDTNSIIVIRDIWWSSFSGDGSRVLVYDSTDTAIMQDSIPSYEFDAPFGHWTGRQVIEQGDSFSVYSDASDLSVRISGYSLSS